MGLLLGYARPTLIFVDPFGTMAGKPASSGFGFQLARPGYGRACDFINANLSRYFFSRERDDAPVSDDGFPSSQDRSGGSREVRRERQLSERRARTAAVVPTRCSLFGGST